MEALTAPERRRLVAVMAPRERPSIDGLSTASQRERRRFVARSLIAADLAEPDSRFAEALVRTEPDLLVPDFWLHEATNVLWLQVRRKLLAPDEAREGLGLLRALVEPTSTGGAWASTTRRSTSASPSIIRPMTRSMWLSPSRRGQARS